MQVSGSSMNSRARDVVLINHIAALSSPNQAGERRAVGLEEICSDTSYELEKLDNWVGFEIWLSSWEPESITAKC